MGIRIIVHEPKNWNNGNLFGEILSDRSGKKLIVKLIKPIKGELITSDIIELKPQSEKDTFKPLFQYYSVMINGNLIDEKNEVSEYVISGIVIMRFLKIISIFFLTIFILLVIWIKLPISLKYYNAIELGNKFAKNIETYNKQNKQLPEEMDWKTLKRLNKSELYETWWPT